MPSNTAITIQKTINIKKQIVNIFNDCAERFGANPSGLKFT